VSKPDPRALRDEAQASLAKGKPRRALEAYQQLAKLEPSDGTWPHRAGELLHRLGDSQGAIVSLRRAVEVYARAGFLLKAVAMCKLILRIDPHADDARQRLGELNSDRGMHIVPRAPAPIEAPRAVVPPPPPQWIEDSQEIPLEIDIEFDAPEVSVRARNALAQSALVAAVSADQLGAFIDRCTLVELAAGEVLFRQGQSGNALYVVAAGEVAVVDEAPPRTELGRLGESSFIEEMCQAEPALFSVILAAVRERLVQRLIATSPLFQPFAGDERQALVGRFRCRDAVPGSVLVAQGRRADGLYVILSGRAEVLRYDPSGAEKRITELIPGDFFGEMSLLTGQAAVATVRAATRALVLHLPSASFREVIMTHPQVLAVVGDLAAERRSKLVELEGDGSGFVDGRVNLL
jgi:cAMP-dependent protein kinase regulator